jgi:hypothetical protein
LEGEIGMKQRFVILGTRRYNDCVRLFLQRQDVVEKKETVNMFEIAENPKEYMMKMEQKAIFTQQPDMITIPHDEWKKHEFKTDDVIFIDIDLP